MTLENIENKTFHNGFEFLMNGKLSDVSDIISLKDIYKKYFDKITSRMVHNIIKKYFNKERMTISILGENVPQQKLVEKVLHRFGKNI